MLKVSLMRRLVCVFAITIALGAAKTASADPILPGFDLFNTRPGTFHIIPGVGMVAFTGGPPIVLGTNTDTIVQRLQGVGTLPIDGIATIEIVLKELSLQSTAPVNINGTFFNLVATALPDQALGSMTIVQDDVNGGRFTSTLPVGVLLTFMPVEGGMPFSMNFTTVLMSTCQWSHTPPPNYPTPPNFPSGNFFVVGQCIEMAPTEVHVVEAAQTPEPVTLLLLASGLAGLAGIGRKTKSRKSS